MFRHSSRLLLCILIVSSIETQLSHAQEMSASPLGGGGVVYSDAMQSVIPNFETNRNSNFGQGSLSNRNPWFARVGVASFIFGESASLQANDAVVPGASILISNETTFAFDIGYQFSPKWSATFSTGVPPRLELDGTGPFEGVSYGTTRYAPIVLALQRHILLTPRTSVYVGGGVNYTLQYESVDGFVDDLDIENNVAGVVQVGVERKLNNRLSLFADAKKAFYETDATGSVGGAPIQADITVNPTVLFFGIKYDF